MPVQFNFMYKLSMYKVKIIILLLITVICISSCSTKKSNHQNDREKRNFKGEVYKVKERHYPAKLEFGKVIRAADSFLTGPKPFAFLSPIMEGPMGIEYNEDISFYNNGLLYRNIQQN